MILRRVDGWDQENNIPWSRVGRDTDEYTFIQWLGIWEIRRSQVKGGETRNAPGPKAIRDMTPDIRPHLNIRHPKQQPPGETNAAHQVRTASEHAVKQNSERPARILKGSPTPFGHGPKGLYHLVTPSLSR